MLKTAKKINIEIDGKEYPCAISMGAFDDYFEATGKEPEEKMSTREAGVWLWACTKSACERAGVEFPFERKAFLNSVTPDVLVAWANATQESVEKDSKKKKVKAG